MNRKFLSAGLRHFILCTILSGCVMKPAPTYLNPSANIDSRSADLLSRLSLEEKINMLRYDSDAIERLQIPAHNYWNECLHGVARSGIATVFPQAIGMAAMWDTSYMHTIANAISDEARAKYNQYSKLQQRGIYQGLTFWTPNINIFRDPRWGRGMETYGEDPYLTAELAIPFIKGLQGDNPDYLKLVATAKHFAVHSGPESTRHSFNVWPSEYDMAETYTPQFKRAITEAGVYSVMCAYQSIKGTPCCGNKMLEDMLRNKWGFNGYIVSDCWAINDFHATDAHNIVSTPAEAAAMAVKAGTDLNCGSTYRHLAEAVNLGLISEKEIDVSVNRIIKARILLGQFNPDSDNPYSEISPDVVDCNEHKDIALESARKSIVLLKNENQTLPLNKNMKNIAVIGPNANDLEVLLGNYNGYPSKPVTPLQGIINKLPEAKVHFARGCRIADELPWLTTIDEECLFTDRTLTRNGLRAEYFNNQNLEGIPASGGIDKKIDFIWKENPVSGVNVRSFSARWTGVLRPKVSGHYSLGGEGFSGFKLFVDNKLVTEWDSEHHPRREYGDMELEANKVYDIRVEYFQKETNYPMMRLLWDEPSDNIMQQAISIAGQSDAVILCMGLSPLLEGEEMKVKVPGFEGGDRQNTDLPQAQTRLMKEIIRLRKPTVLVLLNGSALSINWENENIPAIVEAWYPGQAGGTAIADILFGDYNPAGRLPVTFYKSVDQIPAFDSYDMNGKTYRYFKDTPLFQFGHGLSYTTFSYNIRECPKSISSGDSIRITATVTNTGEVDGEEVVQMYVSLPESGNRNAIRSLKGFNRIKLKSGESQDITFVLPPAYFASRDEDNIAVVTPGKLNISVGGRQPDKKSIANKSVAVADVMVKGRNYYIPD